MNNCVCKIFCKIKNQNTIGTGFFCKIPLNDNLSFLTVLITCHRVLNKKNVSKGKTIKLNFNNRDYSLLIDDS